MQKWRLRLMRARRKLRRFTDSIWFFPLLMALGAIGLFVLTSSLDAYLPWPGSPPDDVVRFLVFAGSPNAARSLLAAIATAWATIMGVVFSITLVTIQLTASKYTPQVLAEFEKDKTNQLVLGSFVGMVTYTFLVLKTVRTGEGGQPTFIPVIGTNLAIILAILSLLLLILFLVNVISFIRPHHFIESTAKATAASVPAILAPRRRDWLEPLEPDGKGYRSREKKGSAESGQDDGRAERPQGWEVRATREGSVTALDWDVLLDAVRKQMQDWLRSHPPIPGNGGAQWHLRLEKRLGDSVSQGDVLAVIEAPIPERELGNLASWVQEAYQVESGRRPEGDPEYGLTILGNMGEKAAAADADAQTAVECIGGLFAFLGKIVNVPEPAQRLLVRVDEGSILIERPTVLLFEVAITSISRVVDAAVDKQLGTVPREMGSHATTLLLREARQGRTETVQRLLASLLPLYQHSLLQLETSRLLVPIVTGLAHLAKTLACEKREAEAQLVVEALGQLERTVRGRPEAAAIVREAVA